MDNIKPVLQHDDIKTTAALAKEIYTEHYSPIIGIAQVEYMLNKFQSEESILSQIENNTLYYLIYNENIPIGYFAVELNNPDGKIFLSKLYIRKEARGFGLSKQALQLIKQLSKDNNLTHLWLHVNKNNPSINIYKSLGFKITDAVKNHIGNGFYMDDYIMELELI